MRENGRLAELGLDLNAALPKDAHPAVDIVSRYPVVFGDVALGHALVNHRGYRFDLFFSEV